MVYRAGLDTVENKKKSVLLPGMEARPSSYWPITLPTALTRLYTYTNIS
jgi:hypothetical protein